MSVGLHHLSRRREIVAPPYSTRSTAVIIWTWRKFSRYQRTRWPWKSSKFLNASLKICPKQKILKSNVKTSTPNETDPNVDPARKFHSIVVQPKGSHLFHAMASTFTIRCHTIDKFLTTCKISSCSRRFTSHILLIMLRLFTFKRRIWARLRSIRSRIFWISTALTKNSSQDFTSELTLTTMARMMKKRKKKAKTLTAPTKLLPPTLTPTTKKTWTQ